jgi:hypothetical protein
MIIKPPLPVMTSGTDDEIVHQMAEARRAIAKELNVAP